MSSSIITIDGPAGVGKSTLARLLARHLNLPFLNTGAMFRQMALKLGPGALDLDESELSGKCAAFNFTLKGMGDESELYCNNEKIGSEIRSEEVAALASRFSKRPELRNFLLEAQRKIGGETSLVTEGRDMGTVVFPDAAWKFFLEATPKIRAARRMQDLQKANLPVPPLEEIEASIKQRDLQDRTRPVAPLIPARDAIIIDTSNQSIKQVLDTMLARIRK